MSAGSYKVETLVYDEETKIPVACKKFSLEITDNQEDGDEQNQTNKN
jgi:hypothetical protein